MKLDVYIYIFICISMYIYVRVGVFISSDLLLDLLTLLVDFCGISISIYSYID